MNVSLKYLKHKQILGVLVIFKTIANLFNTEVKQTRLNRSRPEYRVRTTSLQGNIQAKNYLVKYPLFGTKYLDFLDWMKVVDLFNYGEHKTRLGKEKIIKIKSTMNNCFYFRSFTKFL